MTKFFQYVDASKRATVLKGDVWKDFSVRGDLEDFLLGRLLLISMLVQFNPQAKLTNVNWIRKEAGK